MPEGGFHNYNEGVVLMLTSGRESQVHGFKLSSDGGVDRGTESFIHSHADTTLVDVDVVILANCIQQKNGHYPMVYYSML
jgi:hypothetical protein